ncbi:hypothetical protein [Streptomyces sp.]|uniref:hypothetical protein n=1 Tax=Streptomyces sp. TaxID=1931 RepID=UPI002F413BE0
MNHAFAPHNSARRSRNGHPRGGLHEFLPVETRISHVLLFAEQIRKGAESMQKILDAVAGEPAELGRLPARKLYPGVTLHAGEVAVSDGMAGRDKGPRQSLHLGVATPEPAAGEVPVEVTADAIDHDTPQSSVFEPAPACGCPPRYGRQLPQAARHDRPRHVPGSDLAVVPFCGDGVVAWRPGDAAVAHCLPVERHHRYGHADTMLDPEQRVRGFETDFGELAELALVEADRLIPTPGHLVAGGGAAAGDGVPALRRGETTEPAELQTLSDAEVEAQLRGLLAAGSAAETDDQEHGA